MISRRRVAVGRERTDPPSVFHLNLCLVLEGSAPSACFSAVTARRAIRLDTGNRPDFAARHWAALVLVEN
jgi:hypothetical protein